MAKTLLIVRDESLLYTLGHSDLLTPGEPAVIILDRRERDRRQKPQPLGPGERRRSDRRANQDAQKHLEQEGYTVIRPENPHS